MSDLGNETAAALAGLKDFQRATVDYVFEQLYGANARRRFLVADEVGLGKTMVARGVIARALEHLQHKDRVDIVYVCSNADIAAQNVDRLKIEGCAEAVRATRLTLLPLELEDLKTQRINLVALTPGTSFQQTRGGGVQEERAVLYWLLDEAWGIDGPRASLHVLRDYAGAEAFERTLDRTPREKLSRQISGRFVTALQARVQEEKAAGKKDLRTRFEDLRGIFSRVGSKGESGDSRERTNWIGELRQLLARVCLEALKPDLVILDEFQRFRHLLNDETEAGQLARDLIESGAGSQATETRVLLLSATPYRGLSLHHETDDDHYEDFLSLVRFLEDAPVDGYREIVAEYRAALGQVMTADGRQRVRVAKHALESRLRRIMARTERLASSQARGGMLAEEADGASTTMEPTDIRAYLGAQTIAAKLGEGDVVEYWKSAPYLFNFMEDYALKRSLKCADEAREMVQLRRRFPEAFLDFERVRHYEPVPPANAKLRDLSARTLDRDFWKLLWIPPTLPYYQLEAPFDGAETAEVTKQLVFSAWHMAPRAVASLISYEAERRMMRAADPNKAVTQEDWEKRGELLRFSGSAETRLTGLPLLLLVYPSLTFAREYDPREMARNGLPGANEVRGRFAARLREAVLALGLPSKEGGAVDERWYWLAPMLLDFDRDAAASEEWWGKDELSRLWAGDGDANDGDGGWARHIAEARTLVREVRSGVARPLGRLPEDLFEVLALAASAGPASVALRAFCRTGGDGPASSAAMRYAAGQVGHAFLALFNRRDVTEAIRAESDAEPYWVRVLQYAHGGCLQAVVDEYVHILRGSLEHGAEVGDKAVNALAQEIIAALTIRAASLRIDEVTAPPHTRELKIEPQSMRTRFAMRFGDEQRDERFEDGKVQPTRKDGVRRAFNAPFWPFILISTTVGQEGLDFHQYCHAVTHWNLPSNPVDLEQREGRVHRYKGHAVRKNVAAAFGAEALAQGGADVWDDLFAIARRERVAGETDLVPYWLFAGAAKIERHVPILPFSRDVERLFRLRESLAIYRMVFGQNRQEDLIAYLVKHVPEEQRDEIFRELQIDLSPVGRAFVATT